ncbi:MAG: CHAT domain-containing tetratricopeptide repeat protein [Bacteroidota bacterium]
MRTSILIFSLSLLLMNLTKVLSQKSGVKEVSPFLQEDPMSETSAEDENLAPWDVQLKRLIDSARYEEALLLNQQMIDLIPVNGKKDVAISLAMAYNRRSDIYYKMEKFEEGVVCAQKSVELNPIPFNETDSLVLGEAYEMLGHNHERQRDFQNALEFYELALDVKKSLLGNNHIDVGSIYNGMGLCLKNQGEYEQALAYFEQGLEVGFSLPEENQSLLAKVYNNMALIHSDRGEINRALDLFHKTLQQDLKSWGPHHPYVATTYMNIGSLLLEKHDLNQALIYLDKALRIQKRAGGEEGTSVVKIYYNIGNTWILKGDAGKGLEYFHKAMNILIALQIEEDYLAGVVLGGIGTAYNYLEKYSQALPAFEKSLDIFAKIFDENDPVLGHRYVNLGNVYKYQNNFDSALAYYETALTIFSDAYGRNNSEVASIYNNIGLLYDDAGRYEPAIAAFQTALNIFLTVYGPHHPEYANLFTYLGTSYRKMGLFPIAWQSFQKAFASLQYDPENPQAFGDVLDLVALQTAMDGVEYYYLSRYDQSKERIYLDSLHLQYQTQIALEEYIQQEFLLSSTRQYYASSGFTAYEGAIENLCLRNRPDELPEAFVLAEKTKSRQLVEHMQLSTHTGSFELPPALIEKEQQLTVEINYYETKAFEEEFEYESPNDSLLRDYQDQAFSLRQERDALIKEMKEHYPAYYRLRYSQDVVDVPTIQQKLLQSQNQVVLEYLVGNSHIYTFIILPDTFHILRAKKDFPLEDWVRDLRCGLLSDHYYLSSCGAADSVPPESRYVEYATKLYQKLFGPVEALLPEQAHILIVPDGVLGYVPFEMLLTSEPVDMQDYQQYPYLLQEYSINYAYSATLQLEMKQKQHASVPSHTLLACAPSFDSFVLADSTRFQSRLTRLKYNVQEAYQIAQNMEGESLLRETATKSAFIRQASDYQILHLSTHGKANDKAGDYAFLAFHSSPENDFEEVFLFNREIYHLQLNADLVVLSACETGIGELKRGEGIISLARGFSYAGAKSIVTSLWNVNDRSTKVLMETFYANLKSGLSKSEALRQAKLSYIQTSPAYQQSPFFWAAFISIGDEEPIVFRSAQKGFWAVAGLVFVMLLIAVILIKQRNCRSLHRKKSST